jgi:hypothetical protein
MATTRTFQDMLNDYLPNELLKEELVKRDYVLSKIEKDDNWLGGSLVVPFKAAGASSVASGSLTAASDIAEDKFVRGEITTQKEVWGSMIFNHRDLMEHGKVSEQNFLKILPGAVEDHMDLFKNVVSVNLLNGSHFATLTADGEADGEMTVDRPDRFSIGQKVTLKDGNTAAADYYVIAINMNTRKVTVSATRGGAAADISAYTVAQTARCYNDGFDDSAFLSLRGALLSAANGGDTNLHGVAKTSYPYLQAINVDATTVCTGGAAITTALTGSTTLMAGIFDALTRIRQFGRGAPTDVIMSYRNLAHCMKIIESSKGAFNVKPGSQSASVYGWTEIEVGSVTKGGIKLVGVQEADDDVIFFIDWRGLKFHSNGFFRKRQSPDGTEYFEVRNTSGYQYIIDSCLFGELSVTRPSYQGVLFSVPSMA